MPVGPFAVEVSRFRTFYEGAPFPTVALPALCQIGFLINTRARAVSAFARCWRGCWFTRTALMRGSRRAGSYRQAALRMIKSICGGARVKVLRLSSHSLFFHDCILRLKFPDRSRARFCGHVRADCWHRFATAAFDLHPTVAAIEALRDGISKNAPGFERAFS
jgi:hypothetical protein